MKKFSSTQFKQLLEYLYELQRLGIKVGLEHTKQLLYECGNPQNNFRSIHIAGTNGKGSTSAMLASILREAGYKVGLYTSPHLLRFNERIRVNGVPISDEKIVEFVSRFKQAIEKINSTFFEATTALAFSYFSEQKVDIAIVETGLGGRLDSTNVLLPDITVITSITADHTEILGKDLKKIAFEKAGIIKQDTPLILAEQSQEVEQVILEIAKIKNSEVVICNNKYLKNILLSENGTEFSWQNNNYKTSLIGEHQAINSSLAIETIKLFDNKIGHDIINQGIQKVNWPGRMQLLRKNNRIYYDVAHNPHGIEVIIYTLAKMYIEKPVGLMALKADKELDKILPKLENKFEKLFITSESDKGLMEAQELYKYLLKHGVIAELEPNINEAIGKLKQYVTNSKPGLIFGSHYIGKAVFENFGFSFDNGII